MSIAVCEPPVSADALLPHRVPDDTYIPEHSRSELFIGFAAFLASFLYLYLFRSYTWMDPDEGIILQGAQRILDGQVLYRDFFSFFTPGSYYLVALVLRVFGNSYVVAHTALAVIGAGYAPITYFLARRVCSRDASLLVTGLMTTTTLPLRFLVLHNWDSTLWACLGLYCSVRLLESPGNKWAFAAASFASLTALTEQSKGAGLVAGVGLGFGIIIFSGRYPGLFTRQRVGAIAAGLVWPFLITFSYFASQHAIIPMLSGWLWPLQHYSTANRVPYGYLDLHDEVRDFIFYSGSLDQRVLRVMSFSGPLLIPFLPLFGLALLIRLLFRVVRTMTLEPACAYYILVSASMSGLLLFSVVLVRADHMHLIHLQPIFFLVLAWMMDGKDIRGRVFAKVAPLLGFCIAISLIVMAGGLLLRAYTDHTIDTRRGAVTGRGNDTIEQYVQARVKEGERMFVYPYDPIYYYLTGTNSPTRYEYYQPGMHTKEQAQEILNEISTHPVRVVLYDPYFSDHALTSWPNTPASAFAYDPIGDYIMREYRLCAIIPSRLPSEVGWKFWFMVRKGTACP